MSIYQPFLDHAIAKMTEKLDLKPFPIPEDFERKEAIIGKGKKQATVVTTSHAFQTTKLRQIRAAHVQGGNSLQVLNFVIFPQLNYDLPFFGADLVTLPGGHLIALDMQPLFHHESYQKKYTEPILPTFNSYLKDLPWGGDFPEEAKPFFSPAFLWTRPSDTQLVETKVFEAFKDYLEAYLDFVNLAEEITDTQELENIKTAQQNYIHYRSVKDPARGMFTRFYGEEWTEKYIHGFLFLFDKRL